MNLIVVTPPAVEPVTLEELYVFLRLDPDGSPVSHPDDEMLRSMLVAAREKVEAATRRALVQQRVRLVMDRFPSFRIGGGDPDFDFYRDGYIELLRPPLVEVHSVSYYDEQNQLQTLDPSQYYVNDQELVPQLVVANNVVWPNYYPRSDAVRVEYTVGYPADGSPPSDFRANIPEGLRHAVKLEVQLQYDELSPEKRQDVIAAIARLERTFVLPRF